MAFSTHAVPVLALAGPVKPVRVIIRMIGEGIPFFLHIIPGNGQTLKPSPFERNQVLLKGVNAKGVGNLEVLVFSVRPDGVDKKGTLFFKKSRGDRGMNKLCIVEISQQFEPG